MKIDLLLFAQCRSAAGRSALPIDLPDGAGIDDLWAAVGTACPALLPFRAAARVAVNRAYAGLDARIRAGDEVALVPPVSGG